MQKMLTSLAGLAAPPVVRAPAAAPVSEMVRAVSKLVKAPAVRWPQLMKPLTVEQSVSDVHGTGRHGAPLHVPQGTPIAQVQLAPDARPLHLRANVLRVLFLQKPQNTFV